MNTSKNVLNGLKWTGTSSILKSIFLILQYSVLARFLPAEAFGLIAMAMFVVNFSNIFVEMGLTSAILHKEHVTIFQFSSIYWLNIIISVILAFIFYYIIIRNKWNWQRILFYVSLGNMLIGLFIYPITLFSDRTPPLLSIFALNFLPVFHPIKSDLLRNCKNLSPGLRYGNGLFFLIIKTNKN